MSGVDVDLAKLDTIAKKLDSGASGLEGLTSKVPAQVDAGPMSSVIAAMLSQIVSSAGNVAVSLEGSADAVRECRQYYRRADAESGAGFDAIKKVMAQ